MKIFKDELLTATLVSNILSATAMPKIQKVLMTNATETDIALAAITICLFSIFFGQMWLSKSDKLYAHYDIYLIIETVVCAILVLTVTTHVLTYRLYYLIDTFFYCLISRNIIFGANKLKALRYLNDERAVFDNKLEVVMNGASLFGYTVSMVLKININICFMLMLIGNLFDNYFYYQAYRRTNLKLKGDNKDENFELNKEASV